MHAKDKRAILTILIAVLLLALLNISLNPYFFHPDEAFFLYVSSQMPETMPYKDISDFKPFGLFLALWPIAKIASISLVPLTFIFKYLLIFCSTILFYLASKRYLGKRSLSASLLFFILHSEILFFDSFLITEPISIFLILLIVVIETYAKDQRSGFFQGFLFFLFINIRQTNFFFIPFLVFLLKDRINIKNKNYFLSFLLGVILLAAISYGILYFTDSLEDMIFHVYLSFFEETGHSSIVYRGQIDLINNVLEFMRHLFHNPIFFVVFLFSFFNIPKIKNRELSLLFIGCFSIFISPTFWVHALLYFVLPLSFIFSLLTKKLKIKFICISILRSTNSRHILNKSVFSVLLLCLVALLLFTVYEKLDHKITFSLMMSDFPDIIGNNSFLPVSIPQINYMFNDNFGIKNIHIYCYYANEQAQDPLLYQELQSNPYEFILIKNLPYFDKTFNTSSKYLIDNYKLIKVYPLKTEEFELIQSYLYKRVS